METFVFETATAPEAKKVGPTFPIRNCYDPNAGIRISLEFWTCWSTEWALSAICSVVSETAISGGYASEWEFPCTQAYPISLALLADSGIATFQDVPETCTEIISHTQNSKIIKGDIMENWSI